MAIIYCDPNSGSGSWVAVGCVGDHYLCVDDAVRQPNLPDWDTSLRYYDGDESKTEQFGMTNTPMEVGGIATSITIWYCGTTTDNTEDPRCNLFIDGVWKGELVIDLTGGGTRTWYSRTYNGSWNQADINAMNILIKAPPAISTTDYGACLSVYVEVTYTVPPSGYGHDFMGVPAANIGSVNGVPTANIDTIKGV